MKVNEYNALMEKAKTKTDGVYSYHNYLYVVKNHNFIAFSDYLGNCYSCVYGFTVAIGKCDRTDRKKKLVEYLKAVK